jgi:glycoside/pentoside/hexuronide:cation symporter, GPH family
MQTAALGTKDQTGKLSLGRIFGYGLGDFSFNFYWFPLQLFLTYYYTDVLGLKATVAGTITMICLIWDGVVDPYIGILANKTRTRWGRYRPYILLGCVPLAASFTMMFAPVPLKDTSLIVYAFATQLLFRTLYGAVNIPYGAMMATMTRDSMERNSLAGVRMLCAFTGGAIVSYFTPQLVAHFRAGDVAGEPTSAYFIATAILSSCAIVVLLLCFAATREAVIEEDASTPNVSVGSLLRMLATNKPFIQIMTGNALFSFANVLINSSLAYYVQYVLGEPQTLTGKLGGMMPFIQLLAVLPWTVVARIIGKRWAWIAGLAIACSALAFLYFASAPSVAMLYGCLAVYAVGAASMAVNFWSIVPDTVEYGEWRSGIRAEGFIFGFVTLIQKAALGLTSAFLGGYLGWIGYVANQAQSPGTLAGLRLLITAIAGAGLVASAVVMYFYRLNASAHGNLVKEIAERRAVQEGGKATH